MKSFRLETLLKLKLQIQKKIEDKNEYIDSVANIDSVHCVYFQKNIDCLPITIIL